MEEKTQTESSIGIIAAQKSIESRNEELSQQSHTLLGDNDVLINKGPKFGKRHWQIVNLCSLFLTSYLMRINFSVAIVAMTDPKSSSNQDIPTYNWTDKGALFSSMIWGEVITQLPSGWLGSVYGAKWFITGAIFLCSLTSLFIPLAANIFGSKGVMVCRLIQGLTQGFVYPSIYSILAQWLPPEERELGTIVLTTPAVGIVIAMFLSGQLAASWYGWPLIFYFAGAVGLIWCISFAYFGSSGPSHHPTITIEERMYIETSLKKKKHRSKLVTPWKAILTSGPFWAVTFVQIGNIWYFWTIIMEVPLYMSRVLEFHIDSSGALSALPNLTRWLSAFLFGFISNYILRRKICEVGTTRKIMNSIGVFSPAIGLILLGNCSQDKPFTAVTLLVVSLALNSACQSGFQLSFIDISPNFAGVVMGASGVMAHIIAMFAPLFVHAIVTNEENYNEWKIVFYSTAGVYAAAGFMFIFLASGEVQYWNDPGRRGGFKEKEELSVTTK